MRLLRLYMSNILMYSPTIIVLPTQDCLAVVTCVAR